MNNFFAFALPKPENFTVECTIENMFSSEKYEEAYKEALSKTIGHFSNLSIEDINEDIKLKIEKYPLGKFQDF